MKLIPASTLVRYLHATRGHGPRQDEPLLAAVAEQICAALSIPRGAASPRRFVEEHKAEVMARSPRNAKTQAARCKAEAARPPAKVGAEFAVTDAFLQSYEWRRVRMQALKRYGAKCMCCGATPATGEVMNVDHIKPRRLFPDLALDIDNLQVLCSPCNHGKGNWDMTDWRKTTEVP